MLYEHHEMTMTSWKERPAKEMRFRLLNFFREFPGCQVLLAVHTHADAATGQLCNSWNGNKTIAFYNTIEEICDFYLGSDVVAALMVHNGLRGVAQIACGPSMSTEHFVSIGSIINKYVPCSVLYMLSLTNAAGTYSTGC